jgi:16S rRNA (cytosine967-C5)-methyltransferase
MSVVGSQQQTVLRLLRALSEHWRRDPALPTRIQAQLARHKEFGSRDRRLYRELIYTAIRYLPWIEAPLAADSERAIKIVAWLAAETRDTSAFRRETSGDWPELATLRERAEFLHEDAQRLLPEWFRAECAAVFASPELDAQLARAPLWIRLQTDEPAAVTAEFEANGWRRRESAVLPSAWQIEAESDITKAEGYAKGAFEVQDLGSQLLLESVGVPRGGRWFDACAGAGGKTLQLARLVGPDGHVDAHDIRPGALQELLARARRARLGNVQVVTAPRSAYDGVLVDAPCSGSGTWRRSPHLKWTTTPATLADRAAQQQAILRQYAVAVKPGGRLVYATCSLARSENESVIRAFLAAHPHFAPESLARTFDFTPASEGLTILPARHDTDGFFVSVARRTT